MKLPKVDDVRKKARAIEGAKNVTLKEEDIEQVIMFVYHRTFFFFITWFKCYGL